MKVLEQADLKDVSLSQDLDKKAITLGGTAGEARAAEVAKKAAITRIIANEINVQPVGSESQSSRVASNLDDGIEKNYGCPDFVFTAAMSGSTLRNSLRRFPTYSKY